MKIPDRKLFYVSCDDSEGKIPGLQTGFIEFLDKRFHIRSCACKCNV